MKPCEITLHLSDWLKRLKDWCRGSESKPDRRPADHAPSKERHRRASAFFEMP